MTALLFDFDSTLVDSSRGVVECVNNALRCLGLAEADEADIRRAIGLVDLTHLYETAAIPDLTVLPDALRAPLV